MLRKFFYSLAASMAVGSSAFAAIIGASTAVTTFTTPDAGLTGQGYTGYILSLSGNAGELISGIDVSITGTMHQRWTVDADTGDVSKTPQALTTATGAFSNGDSKLTPVTGALIITAPNEDNSGTGSPLADTATRDYGLGSFLKGVWGIPGPSQASTASVGYIVIPNGSAPNVQATVQISANGGSGGGTLTGTLAQIFGIGTPVVPGVLVSTPVPGAGTEINFGTLFQGADPASLPISLQNTAAGSNPITISGITLAGADAARFVLTGTLPTSLAGGAAAQAFGVDMVNPTVQGTFSAQVLVNTSAGNLSFDVAARVIPEPATLALAGLAVVGLVGFTRRK